MGSKVLRKHILKYLKYAPRKYIGTTKPVQLISYFEVNVNTK